MGSRAADADAIDDLEGEGPLRTCVATRIVRPVDELIRFVVAPDDTLAPDLRHRLPGRGVWVTATRQAVTEAMRKKAFARSLKASVKVSATLPDDLDALLRRAAREAASLANKAGLVVTGFSKVEAAIGREPLAGVVHAADAAPDGVRKIAQALRRRFGNAAEAIPVIAALDSADLDLALGRSHVIHAALLDGPASRAAIARMRALERYRDPSPPLAADAGATSATDDPGTRRTRAE